MRYCVHGAYIAYTNATQAAGWNKTPRKNRHTENTSKEKGFIKPSENTIQFQFGDKHGVA